MLDMSFSGFAGPCPLDRGCDCGVLTRAYTGCWGEPLLCSVVVTTLLGTESDLQLLEWKFPDPFLNYCVR